MQDLGGCRAVVNTIEQVDALVLRCERRPGTVARFQGKKDYISKPKPDGYRGVHLVYAYNSRHENQSCYDGLQIEIQIRSRYQHAWATAVEIIDTFTGQGLKSGLGDDSWKRFFVLISSFIAAIEKRPEVEGTPGWTEWYDELKGLIDTLKVIPALQGMSQGLHLTADIPAAAAYILVLDRGPGTTQKVLDVSGFDSEEEGAQKYIEIERETMGNPEIQAVMVSVDSVDALREAYPNYYLDTASFIGILKGFMGERE